MRNSEFFTRYNILINHNKNNYNGKIINQTFG